MASATGFPAISDYALIGDCRTAALVSSAGAVEWLCLPDFDSPAFFSRILDRERGGYLQVGPANSATVTRRYRDGTGVLETTFETGEGTLRLIDLIAVAHDDGAGLLPERELLRIAEVTAGSVELEVVFKPRPNFARRKIRLEERGALGWTISGWGNLWLLRSDIKLIRQDGDVLAGRARLARGERRYLSLSFAQRDTGVIPPLGSDADARLAHAQTWWETWSGRCSYQGPYREAVMRSVATLKQMQQCLSGAVIAAPTTSLPEALGGGRNWDYRFCWLRDAAFTLRAFTDTGHHAEAGDFLDWLMYATRQTQPRLRLLYDVYGRSTPRERELKEYAGYANSAPVRTGNGARGQLQLDIYGSVVSAAATFVARGGVLDPGEGRLLARLGETVCAQWRKPDNGIWEYRGRRRHNTWSKAMCWSALNDLLELDAKGLISVDRRRFESERAAIRTAIFQEAVDSDGVFTGALGEAYLDATALLLPRIGLVEPDDKRMQATWGAVEQRLQNGVLVHRYEHGADDLAGREGAFVICSFWAVDYLARAGRLDEARERMDKLVATANDVGLLSEEIDVENGAMLGNFPQAFSHSGLINAALVLAEFGHGDRS